VALCDGRVHVGNAEFAPFKAVLPLHYYIADRSGKVLIAEFVGGKLRLHDNPLGVLTNSPTFDWHLVNLGNYVNLSAMNASGLRLHREKFAAIGQGSGALGLPGDWTPPSRFVRAALFSQWAALGATAADTARIGLHVLNTFDIFDGAIQNPSPVPGGHDAPFGTQPQTALTDITQWIIAHDRENLRTYVRTYESLAIQVVDLKKIDFTTPGLRQIELQKEFMPQEISHTAQPLR
jgi:choloylglycine hydrolase